MTPARRVVLAFALILLCAPPARAHGAGQEYRVLVFWADRVSFEQLLETPEILALARAGGAGLLTSPETARPLVDRLVQDPAFPGLDEDVDISTMSTGGIVLGARIRQTVEATPGDLLVIVAGVTPSKAMEAANDRVTGIVVARGHAEDLFPLAGSPRALTSDSTRRPGIVAAVDVVPAILDHMGWPISEETAGSKIRYTAGAAPFELHARHLANMRIWLPVQVGAGVYLLVAGLGCLVLLLARRRVPGLVGRAATWAPLTVGPLGAALLAAGDLPSLSAAWVVPFVLLVPAAVVGASGMLRRRGVLAPAAAVGAIALAYVVVEALAGFPAALTPFLGGTQLDGARFYGLPNAFIGLLLGSSVYAATRLLPLWGLALILATGLLAGLPMLGANHGAALTLFAGAGLWLALRVRGRLDARGIAIAVATAVVGMTVVVAAHALSPVPTHGTRFLAGIADDPGSVWGKLADRLLIGLRLIARSPAAVVPALGAPVSLYFLLRPRGILREALEAHPVWRDALLAILLASVVAYLGNDTGPAAAGLGFGMGLGGMLYVSMAQASWRMEL